MHKQLVYANFAVFVGFALVGVLLMLQLHLHLQRGLVTPMTFGLILQGMQDMFFVVTLGIVIKAVKTSLIAKSKADAGKATEDVIGGMLMCCLIGLCLAYIIADYSILTIEALDTYAEQALAFTVLLLIGNNTVDTVTPPYRRIAAKVSFAGYALCADIYLFIQHPLTSL